MVAGSVAAYLADSVAPNAATKCRYKTGKCTNMRSSKRNGQPHQLCLYHREKANKIQRKFDRQKRQVARVRKTGAAVSVKTMAPASASAASALSASNVLDLGLASAFALSSPFASSAMMASPSSSTTSSSFATLAAHDVDIYSDSDSSRFSTDSDSSRLSTDSESSAVLDLMWQDLPRSAVDLLSGGLDTPMTSAPVGCHQSYLSSDELDFLCSAILE
jgi:hypothetical protein